MTEKDKKKVVTFADKELEIAMITYNRPRFVKEWLECCLESIIERNIELTIYDSSTNNETELLIYSVNKERATHIKYLHLDSDIELGYKPVYALLASKAEYVWVVGDSRWYDFKEVDKNVFPYIKQKVDYILLHIIYNKKNIGKIYLDKSEFIHDCFIAATCVGLSIYKTSMFACLNEELDLMRSCDEKFQHNYGFAWLGYFFTVYAQADYKAAYTYVKIKDIFPKKKKQVWAKRFYECWVENLCEIIDQIPDVYNKKKDIPYETWQRMHLDSVGYCHRARISGGLNPQIVKTYIQNGQLERVSHKIKRIKFFASAPMWIVQTVYIINKVIFLPINILKKINNLWSNI